MTSESAREIAEGLRRAGWSAGDLWWAALAVGGAFAPLDIELIIAGLSEATPSEHDILAAAINDHFVDEGRDHPVRYWQDLPRTG